MAGCYRAPPHMARRFRLALMPRRSDLINDLSIVGYALMVLGNWLLLMFRSLFSPSIVAVTLQFAAAILFVWARLTLGRRSFHAPAAPTPGGIVMSGPYRFVRHPIYAAILLFALSGAAANWSRPGGIAAAVLIIGVAIRVVCEEWLLAARHPEYRQYAQRTTKLVPFIF